MGTTNIALASASRQMLHYRIHHTQPQEHIYIQRVYCTTWPAVARAGETHVTFTAFPLSFPCDAHIPHLSSLVRQSDLCSRPVRT